MQYQGGTGTVFQDFVHELGHVLGLLHNTGDTNSVMYPVTSGKNILPDASDIATIQSLYGKLTSAPVLSSAEIATLNHLVLGFIATAGGGLPTAALPRRPRCRTRPAIGVYAPPPGAIPAC